MKYVWASLKALRTLYFLGLLAASLALNAAVFVGGTLYTAAAKLVEGVTPFRTVWMENGYADFARAHYVEGASGVAASMKNVTREVILGFPFPFPPLAKQHHVVAKIDALMAMCDRPEASLAAPAATRRRPLDALLAETVQPVDAREVQAAG